MYDAPLENPEHAMYDDMAREIEDLQRQVEDLKDGNWPLEWQVATVEREARKRAEERYKAQHATISELRANQARLGMDREKARSRLKELETALIATDDALYWLLNLLHGMSKGGPEFSPPSNAEWTGAIGQGKEAHDIAETALKGGDA